MTNTNELTQGSDLSPEDYCVLGLATCFAREDGEIHQLKVVEPIPSAALEAILKGVPTSYEFACAKNLGEILTADTVTIPQEFAQQENVILCDRFTERVMAATRTYKSRPEAAKYIAVGTVKQDFNYSLERKRVLNVTNVVRAEDNIKQHAHTHKVL